MNSKTIGSEIDCDLILDHSSISELHARLELDGDGHVYVIDSGSDKHTFLNRNDHWIRVHKVCLCIADRIRFGELEVALPQLIAVFGKDAGVRLGDKHFSLRKRNSRLAEGREKLMDSAPVERPRRNPLTGKIEQQAFESNAQKEQTKDR